MLFYDNSSCRIFEMDAEELIRRLIELERDALLYGKRVTYNDYYKTVGLREICIGELPIGEKSKNYEFQFEIYYEDDSATIIIDT